MSGVRSFAKLRTVADAKTALVPAGCRGRPASRWNTPAIVRTPALVAVHRRMEIVKRPQATIDFVTELTTAGLVRSTNVRIPDASGVKRSLAGDPLAVELSGELERSW